MHALYIRNLSPEAYECLKERAKRNRRSITQEAAITLEEALIKPEGRFDIWRQIDQIREHIYTKYGSFGESSTLIREDRKR